MAPVVGLGLYMMMNPVFLGGAKRTPMASRVGLSLGAKGLMFLSYQLLTENARAFKRFASTKANLILNCIESVGWPAAVGVTIYGIMQFCIGVSCTLSYVMIVLAVFLSYVFSLLPFYSRTLPLLNFANNGETDLSPSSQHGSPSKNTECSKLRANNQEI